MVQYYCNTWIPSFICGLNIIFMYLTKYKEWLLILENIKILSLLETTFGDNSISLNKSKNGLIINGIRLRAGSEHMVAIENPAPIPFRSINTRRGNAMRFMALDFMKEKPLRSMRGLYVILSKDKRKAMENIAADALFYKIDAFPPEERFYPLHVKPTGDTYYIPEKKIDQMAYVVNKFKKRSVDSIVSEVTWDVSDSDIQIKELDEIVDLKTHKLKENSEKCNRLVDEIEEYSFVEEEDYVARTSFSPVDSGKPFRSVYESTSSTTLQPKNLTGKYDYCVITCASEAIIRPKPGVFLPRCVSDDDRCTCKKIETALKEKDKKKKKGDKKDKKNKKKDKSGDKSGDKSSDRSKDKKGTSKTTRIQASMAQLNITDPFSNVVEDQTKSTKIQRRARSSSSESEKSKNRSSSKESTDRSKKTNYHVYSVTEVQKTAKSPIQASVDTMHEVYQKTPLSPGTKREISKERKEIRAKVIQKNNLEKNLLKTKERTDANDTPELPIESSKLSKHRAAEKLPDISSEALKQSRAESVRHKLTSISNATSNLSTEPTRQVNNEKLHDKSSKTSKESRAESVRQKLVSISNDTYDSPESTKQSKHRTKENKNAVPSESSRQSRQRLRDTSETKTQDIEISENQSTTSQDDKNSDQYYNVYSMIGIEQNTLKSSDIFKKHGLERVKEVDTNYLSAKKQAIVSEGETKKKASRLPSTIEKSVKSLNKDSNQTRASILKNKSERTDKKFEKAEEANVEIDNMKMESKQHALISTSSLKSERRALAEFKSNSTDKGYTIYNIDGISSHDLRKEHSEETKKESTSKTSRPQTAPVSSRSSKDQPKQKLRETTDKNHKVDLNLVKQKLEQLDLPDINSNEDKSTISTNDSFLGTLIKQKLKEINSHKTAYVSPQRSGSPEVSKHNAKISPNKGKPTEKNQNQVDKKLNETSQDAKNKTKLLESTPFFVKSATNSQQGSSSSNPDNSSILERVKRKSHSPRNGKDSSDDDQLKKTKIKPNNEYMSFSLYKIKHTPQVNTGTNELNQATNGSQSQISSTTSVPSGTGQFFLHKKECGKRNSKIAIFNNLFRSKSRELSSSSKQSQHSVKIVDKDREKSTTSIMRLLKLTKKSKDNFNKDKSK